METVDLGFTGLQVSRLCFGTGTNGWNHRSNQGDLGLEHLPYLLRFAHEHGVTFWDTADQYGTHPHIAATLNSIERESVTITTKTVSRSAAEVRQDIERFFSELDTDYLDNVLLHCLTDADWPKQMQGPMDVLSEYKDRGRIRALGVSCHDFGAFQTTAHTDWVDVVLARINYATHSMDAAPNEVLPVIDQMVAAGKGVYGMKIVGGGSELTQDPSRAIRFVLENSAVHAMVLGMMNEQEILENIGLVDEFVTA
jgi:predicted aldo/keto reductase-like oxidoreductase